MNTPRPTRPTAAALILLTVACGGGQSELPPAASVGTPQAARTPIAEGSGDEQTTPPPETTGTAPEGADLAAQVVGASDRDPADREKDGLRHPEELLRFTGVTAGMRVADLGAGGGYTTELLARAVGPTGKVFAQNNRGTIERFVKESWPARLAKPVLSNVVRVDAELNAPLPEAAKDLDLVTMIFFYHDAVALGTDMTAMNHAIFSALKPGGLLVIADHVARPGSGTEDTQRLHRIDPETVKAQLAAAGFEWVEDADFLRDTQDTHDVEVWKNGFKTDRFVSKFRKP